MAPRLRACAANWRFGLSSAWLLVLACACATSEDLLPDTSPHGGTGNSASGGMTSTGSGGTVAPGNGGATSTGSGGAPGNGGTTSTGSGGATPGNGGFLGFGGLTQTGSGGATTGTGGKIFGSQGGATATGGGKSASGGATTTGSGGATTGTGGKTSTAGSTGTAGSSSDGCDWTMCSAKQCATACPTNDGNYCAMACTNYITCYRMNPGCGKSGDPLCVARNNGSPNVCTTVWESAGGNGAQPGATGPSQVAAQYVACSCGITIPGATGGGSGGGSSTGKGGASGTGGAASKGGATGKGGGGA